MKKELLLRRISIEGHHRCPVNSLVYGIGRNDIVHRSVDGGAPLSRCSCKSSDVHSPIGELKGFVCSWAIAESQFGRQWSEVRGNCRPPMLTRWAVYYVRESIRVPFHDLLNSDYALSIRCPNFRLTITECSGLQSAGIKVLTTVPVVMLTRSCRNEKYLAQNTDDIHIFPSKCVVLRRQSDNLRYGSSRAVENGPGFEQRRTHIVGAHQSQAPSAQRSLCVSASQETRPYGATRNSQM
jgi:hypothetical protein